MVSTMDFEIRRSTSFTYILNNRKQNQFVAAISPTTSFCVVIVNNRRGAVFARIFKFCLVF